MKRPRGKRSNKKIILVAGVSLAVLCTGGTVALSYATPKPILSAVALAARAAPTPVAEKVEKSKFEITANDNGKTYSFPPGVHFSVFLDEEHYPKNELVCSPVGVVAHASVMPVATLPLYAVRFDTVAPGSCRMHNKDFSMTVVVEDGVQ